MEWKELCAFDIPMGLLRLAIKIERVSELLVQQGDNVLSRFRDRSLRVENIELVLAAVVIPVLLKKVVVVSGIPAASSQTKV